MNNEEIIVVYEKKIEEFAHMLSQLISSYAKHEVAEWEVKHWDSNKPTVPSSLKIIFLGSAGNAYQMGVEWHYNNFSMKYGWLGNRCLLDVDLIELGQVGAFKKHYKERSAHFKHIASTIKNGGAYGHIAGGAGFAFLANLVPALFGWFAAPIIFGGWFLRDRAKLKKYQYQLLICEFVFEGGFKKFRGE